MSRSLGLGGWWRRLRLSGWKTWRPIWRPKEDKDE